MVFRKENKENELRVDQSSDLKTDGRGRYRRGLTRHSNNSLRSLSLNYDSSVNS